MLGLGLPEWLDIVVAATTLGVVVATAVLATKTASMAEQTKRAAEATEKQAEITAEALAASIRPWLTVRPGDSSVGIKARNANHVEGFVALVNVGSGIALVKEDGALVCGGSLERKVFAKAPVVPPGGDTILRFEARDLGGEAERFLGRQGASWGQVMISIIYSDASDGQAVRAEVDLASIEAQGQDWICTRIRYYNPGDDTPFESVEFEPRR